MNIYDILLNAPSDATHYTVHKTTGANTVQYYKWHHTNEYHFLNSKKQWSDNFRPTLPLRSVEDAMSIKKLEDHVSQLYLESL